MTHKCLRQWCLAQNVCAIKATYDNYYFLKAVLRKASRELEFESYYPFVFFFLPSAETEGFQTSVWGI